MKTMRWTLAIWILVFCISGAENAFPVSRKKIKIQSVSIEGNNAFTDHRLYRVMLSRPSSFLKPVYYYPEILEDDIKNLELFYHQQGYLEAQVTDHQVFVDDAGRQAHIQIEISEGEITRVEGVSVLGNTVFPDDVLFQKIHVRSGDIFMRTEVENATLKLITMYADSGYLDADIKPDIRVDSQDHRALIDFPIQEKQQFRVGEIHINGLDKTKRTVLMRELTFKPGEVIQYTRLHESQYEIYKTGLFQSVFIRPQPPASGDSTKKDILIDMKENMSGEFNIALGYGSVDKARGKMEIYNNNVRGMARKIGFTAKMSFITRGIEASFTEPRTLGTSWQTDVNTYMEFQEEPGYNLNRNGGKVTTGRTVSRNTTMTFAYRQEYTKVSHVRLSILPKEKDVNIRSGKLSLIHDSRDNLFNSTRGLFTELSTELGGFFSAGVDRFLRSDLVFKYFYSMQGHTVCGTALEVGWMETQSKLAAIPLQERFYSGGPNSLRAFYYQKVGPLDENRVPVGGMLKLVWNVIEIRRSLYGRLGGTLFVDAGNVWMKPGDFTLSDIRTAAGLGLRFNTPIGLARLDYGFNVKPRKGESSGKLYFSMGQAF